MFEIRCSVWDGLCRCKIYSSSQFTDDTFFFPNDLQCILNVKRMLRWFNLCLGLYVNFYKSSLVGMNIDEIFAEGISGVLRCRCDILPIKYLDLSFGSNSNRIPTWKPVVSKIHGRLSSWKGRLLSMTRRVLLIKKHIICHSPLLHVYFPYPKGNSSKDHSSAISVSMGWEY